MVECIGLDRGQRLSGRLAHLGCSRRCKGVHGLRQIIVACQECGQMLTKGAQKLVRAQNTRPAPGNIKQPRLLTEEGTITSILRGVRRQQHRFKVQRDGAKPQVRCRCDGRMDHSIGSSQDCRTRRFRCANQSSNAGSPYIAAQRGRSASQRVPRRTTKVEKAWSTTEGAVELSTVLISGRNRLRVVQVINESPSYAFENGVAPRQQCVMYQT